MAIRIMSSIESSFANVWDSVCKHEGELFHTKTGLPFTYWTKGTSLYVDRTTWAINRKNLLYAYGLWPVSGPGVFNNAVRGPAYVWAIFADGRIIKTGD